MRTWIVENINAFVVSVLAGLFVLALGAVPQLRRWVAGRAAAMRAGNDRRMRAKRSFQPPNAPLHPVRWQVILRNNTISVVVNGGSTGRVETRRHARLVNEGKGDAFHVRLGDDGRKFVGPGSWDHIGAGSGVDVDLRPGGPQDLVVEWHDANGEMFRREVDTPPA